MSVKAPYNFVPLPEHVFFPQWADMISHDVPFKDGLDGTIELTITAQTPIFIRNGHANSGIDNTFCHTPDGTYFIPATSIKGCIRSVLEIMSFGKMKPITSKISEYRQSPADLEKKRQTSSAAKQNVLPTHLDLAECIFGTVDSDNKLRGRVQFSNFICIEPVEMGCYATELHYILNNPEPACLPLYVQKDVDYNSNCDSKDILNGWKRYVLKKSADIEAAKERTEEDENMLSTIQPLNKGSVFKGKLHYHNLLPQELGALLCALTWNNNEEVCFHQIGQAKPYGYGQIQIFIDGNTDILDNYISIYQDMMDEWLLSMGWMDSEDGPWYDAMPIQELLILASELKDAEDDNFKYMNNNEIREAKENGDILSHFSDL